MLHGLICKDRAWYVYLFHGSSQTTYANMHTFSQRIKNKLQSLIRIVNACVHRTFLLSLYFLCNLVVIAPAAVIVLWFAYIHVYRRKTKIIQITNTQYCSAMEIAGLQCICGSFDSSRVIYIYIYIKAAPYLFKTWLYINIPELYFLLLGSFLSLINEVFV